MRILVLQHSAVETAGLFGSFAREDGHTIESIRADKVSDYAALTEFDALWVMGGAVNVWEEAQFPWLSAEKAFIQKTVAEQGTPFLGFCLGHQLLADALGGEVGPSETPEIGLDKVQLTDVGASGVLFDGFPEEFDVLQWHGAEVKKLPAGARVLATSTNCAVQAMKWETRAASVQFHLEAGPDVFESWFSDQKTEDALVKAIGQTEADKLIAKQRSNFRAYDLAERLYINWLQMTSRT